MKFGKLGAILVAIAMMVSGCTTIDGADQGDDEKYSIVVSTFYEYDWIMQILGDEKDNFEVLYLMDLGVDLHSYEPTARDIVAIGEADLFVYNGGNSHNWVEDIVAEPINESFRSISVLESLGDVVVPEVSLDGPAGEGCNHEGCDHEHEDGHDHEHEDCDHEHEDDHDHEHEHEDCDHEHDNDNEHGHEECDFEYEECNFENEEGNDHEAHYDEHIWLSLRNAQTVVSILATEIATIDTENADVYLANAKLYNQQLSDLDKEYIEVVDGAARDTIVFADRFPFFYMMNDYGIKYYAAFAGCSAESEASFETIKFLAQKVDELGAKKLVILHNGLEGIANTINESITIDKCEILTLNQIEAVSQSEIDAGATYLKYMEENLEVIKQALAE